jgi:SAM-dependent methyltransferase
MPAAHLDYRPIKSRQQLAWSTGNYAVIGTTLQSVGENLCEALDIRAGSRVLDVAAGNGNASLAAARRWCEVTSTDYVPDLLETARRRALAENLTIAFREADAEDLPFTDGAFDVVLSTFGVMFTPDQEKGRCRTCLRLQIRRSYRTRQLDTGRIRRTNSARSQVSSWICSNAAIAPPTARSCCRANISRSSSLPDN